MRGNAANSGHRAERNQDATIASANTCVRSTEETERMARKRYQHGSVILRGENWTGIYREDVRLPDGP